MLGDNLLQATMGWRKKYDLRKYRVVSRVRVPGFFCLECGFSWFESDVVVSERISTSEKKRVVSGVLKSR